jgi:hypothetical protein
LSILEFVKRLVVIGLILVAAFSADAQVFFRNDFLITHRQHRKVENLGLRFITINVTNHPNWNQLINGRGGGTMVIDVRALREPSRRYSYSEIAEKVYVPATITEPRVVTVPQFLLQPPPVQRRLFFPLKRVYLTGI